MIKKLYGWFGRGIFLTVSLGLFFVLIIDRKPMAINLVNHLQGTPQSLLQAVQEKKSLDERRSWEAVHYYKDRLRLSPDDTGAMTSLGYLFTGSKAYAQALSVYERALKVKPDLFGIRYDVAFIQYRKGDVRASYRTLSEMLKQKPVMAEDGLLGFIKGESLNEQNARVLLLKVAKAVSLGQNASDQALISLLEECFDGGLFYFVSLRSYQSGGKTGVTFF